MAKLKSDSTKNKILKLCVAFLFPFTLFGGIASINVARAETAIDYLPSYNEEVSVTNSDFTNGTVASASNNLNGWTVADDSEDSTASGMFVDVGSGSSSEGEGSNETFNKNQEAYMLQSNPLSIGNDSRILMINSKQNESNKNVRTIKGYQSNSVTLEANSYYILSVLVKTSSNGDSFPASASIYISGLEDKDGKAIDAGIENIRNTTWQERFIYIATGEKSQTITIDLYLGGKSTLSSGAVFFDEVNLYRHSENSFYEDLYAKKYEGDLLLNGDGGKSAFIVDGLIDKSSLIDTSDYNFDFEEVNDSSNTLGDSWSLLSRQNGHARVINIRNMSPNDFADLTGYTYIGDDLSYNNSKALALYTKGQDGYVGVQSKELEIKAHGIYKISFNLKVAEITSGTFYLKVKENDTIYNLYSSVITSDQEDTTKDYLPLQEGQTSGISSNSENNFTNDYQTVEFYIKGHALYDTFVNLEFWLGDSSTSANGCVVIDNVSVEYATNEELASASNSLSLTTNSSSNVPNARFDATEFDGDVLEYPVKASNWTTSLEDDAYNKSGVVYLYDQATFNDMYGSDEYRYLGSFPGYPSDAPNVSLPNNVYMMYNSKASYQSITSESYPISENSYYKMTFDYYIPALTGTTISLEVVDENGIQLFYQDGITGYGSWRTFEVYIHTAETVAHNLQIVINLGEEDGTLSQGLVYIDNVLVSTSSESEFTGAQSNKVDLSDYFLSLGSATNDITESPAYDFTVSQNDSDNPLIAEGGIISGSDNPFGSEFVNDKNYLVIHTNYESEATLTSKYSLTLSSENYYKLTFDLATIFDEYNFNIENDEDHECKYGVTVSIDGFEPITQIVTAGHLQSYSIYIHSSSEITPTIAFTLVSDCFKTIGNALITNIDVTTVEEAEYTNASIASTNGETSFVAELSESDASEDEPDENPDEETPATPEGTSPWLLVSSLIFGLAIIVAIVGFVLRHIKIKKIEKIRKENYDRKLSKNHDVILVEAQKRRDQEVQDLLRAKKMLEEDKVRLEENHKEFMKDNRLNNKGAVTREVEKEIKKYNNDIIKIDEKINIISEKIDAVMSADYLLVLERKIVAEEDTIYRNERKAYKAELRELKKQNKEKATLNEDANADDNDSSDKQ